MQKELRRRPGGDLLVIDLPSNVDMSDYAIVEEGAPSGWYREWCVPAKVLNKFAVVRKATAEETEQAGW